MYASLIRTVTPIVAGVVITLGLQAGLHLNDATVTDLVQAVVSAGYYAVFRWAETRYGRAWGWALGLAKPPTYPDPSPTAPASAVTGG